MKQFIILPLLIAAAVTAKTQTAIGGRLKISIDYVKCIQKSWDGVVEFDGHGNEISVAYSYRIFNPSNPNAAKKGMDGTVIYGSAVNGMTKAGTQTPDLGGIKEGDVVNIYKTVFDEHINADEYVLLAPAVWEWDGPEKVTYNTFYQMLSDDLFWFISQPYPYSNTPVNYFDPFTGRCNGASQTYPAYNSRDKYKTLFKKFVCPTNGEGNKPIGLAAGTSGGCDISYQPTLLLLDTKVLYAQYSGNRNAVSTGTSHADKESRGSIVDGITVNCRENIYVAPDSYGKYDLRLKIEFTPDAPAAPVPVKNISKGPLGTINISNTNLAVAGSWAGTQTNDYGLYPQAIVFELTANGEYLIKTAGGTLAAQGTYSFSNNILKGSYKLFSSSETYSFTATYDPVTQKLSGTQGAGTSVTGQGKWTAARK